MFGSVLPITKCTYIHALPFDYGETRRLNACLSRTMNEKLAKITEELSNAKALAEANRKRAAEEKERADEAVAGQAAMVEEVEAAREISQYNAQLHRYWCESVACPLHIGHVCTACESARECCSVAYSF